MMRYHLIYAYSFTNLAFLACSPQLTVQQVQLGFSTSRRHFILFYFFAIATPSYMIPFEASFEGFYPAQACKSYFGDILNIVPNKQTKTRRKRGYEGKMTATLHKTTLLFPLHLSTPKSPHGQAAWMEDGAMNPKPA